MNILEEEKWQQKEKLTEEQKEQKQNDEERRTESKEKGKGQGGGIRCHVTSPATNCLLRVNKTMIPGALLFSQS